MSTESEIRYRVVEAQVRPFVAKLPFKVPEAIKMFFRTTDWGPAHIGFYSREEADEVLKELRDGCLSDIEGTSIYVRDIEEVHVEYISS